MLENFEYRGKWFLPEKPDNKLSGNLIHDIEKGTYLELMGSFDESIKSPNYGEIFSPEIILGITTSGDEVTLHRCRQAQMLLSGTVTTKFSINFIFIGAHFYNNSEIKFRSISASFKN